jgi:hypothetical protein
MFVNCPKETLLLQAKEDCSYRVHSYKMVLGTVRREAGPQERRPKSLKAKLTQGDHQAQVHSDQLADRRLDLIRGCQRGSRERWKKTLESRKPSRKTGIVTAKRKFKVEEGS